MKRKKWTIEQLKKAVKLSKSIRQVIAKLGLVEAGGNYEQIKRTIKENSIDTAHFTGMAWNKGNRGLGKPRVSLKDILVDKSNFQSFKLKKRLFLADLKKKKCEECGWNKQSVDGRIPLELHHENGDKHDNRIDNLKILCPNCHSLKPNHRGKNIKKK